jgi:hypothetical protein
MFLTFWLLFSRYEGEVAELAGQAHDTLAKMSSGSVSYLRIRFSVHFFIKKKTKQKEKIFKRIVLTGKG